MDQNSNGAKNKSLVSRRRFIRHAASAGVLVFGMGVFSPSAFAQSKVKKHLTIIIQTGDNSTVTITPTSTPTSKPTHTIHDPPIAPTHHPKQPKKPTHKKPTGKKPTHKRKKPKKPKH